MKDEHLERLSDYLRKGAKLTSETCPICGTLLVEISGKLYCVKCEREVIFASSKDEYVELSSKLTLTQLKEVLIKRIDDIRKQLVEVPNDSSSLEILDKYLSILEKIDNLLSS